MPAQSSSGLKPSSSVLPQKNSKLSTTRSETRGGRTAPSSRANSVLRSVRERTSL